MSDIFERLFKRCLTCNKPIDDGEPHIIAYKYGIGEYFCKEHVDDAKQYLAYFREFVDVREGEADG